MEDTLCVYNIYKTGLIMNTVANAVATEAQPIFHFMFYLFLINHMLLQLHSVDTSVR